MLRKLNAADWVTGFINYLLPFFITLRLCLSAAVCRRNKNQELRELESRKQRAAVREFYTARFFPLLPATIRWIKDALINCASTPRGENLLGMARLIEMGRLLGGVLLRELFLFAHLSRLRNGNFYKKLLPDRRVKNSSIFIKRKYRNDQMERFLS